jgi:hypothetical protein
MIWQFDTRCSIGLQLRHGKMEKERIEDVKKVTGEAFAEEHTKRFYEDFI